MTFMLFGVGNIFRADDGLGPNVAGRLLEINPNNWKIFNCATAPENFTGVVRHMHPKLLVIVDAADMNLSPGSIRVIPAEKIHDTTIGTHMMALSHLVRFLSDAADEIMVIGVQPKVLDDSEGLSLEVSKAADIITQAVCDGDVFRFSVL